MLIKRLADGEKLCGLGLGVNLLGRQPRAQKINGWLIVDLLRAQPQLSMPGAGWLG